MSFDSAVGILGLSVGFAGIVLGLLLPTTPERRKRVLVILAICGAVLILLAAYFPISYLNHERHVQRIKATILSAVANQPLTFEQIRDTVGLTDSVATSEEIVEAIDRLTRESLLSVKKVNWQDVNARQFYTKVYSR